MRALAILAVPVLLGASWLAAGVRAFAAAPSPATDPSDTPDASDDGRDAGLPRDAATAPSGDLPLVVIVTAHSDTGTLPRTGFGIGGGLGLDAKPFRLEATLAYWPTVSTSVATVPSSGGSFTMVVTELRGCALADVGHLSLGGCAGWGFTNMQAQTFNATTSISTSNSWSSFVADALLIGRVSRPISLRVSAGMATPFSRPMFEVEGLLVHQPATVSLELGAGVEALF